MSGRRGTGPVAAGMLLALLGASEAAGQRRNNDQWLRGPSAFVGLNLIAADPIGDFGLLVDDGFGLEAEGRFPLGRSGVLALRLDGGFIVYGRERTSTCFALPVGCRIGVDLTTTNSIAFAGVGPELAVPGQVSPYVNASVGISYFSTRSSLSGIDDYDEDFSTRNYSDLVSAARLGGGVRVQLGRTSGGPILLDVGGQYHRNGAAEYLRAGDIVDLPDGSIEIFPNRTEANLVTFRLGVTFGLGARSVAEGPGERHPNRR